MGLALRLHPSPHHNLPVLIPQQCLSLHRAPVISNGVDHEGVQWSGLGLTHISMLVLGLRFVCPFLHQIAAVSAGC